VGVALTCLALAVGAGVTAGCGDDDDEATTPTTEPATLTGPTGPATDGAPENGRDEEGGGGGDVDLEDGTVTPPPETDPDNLPAEPAPQPEDSPENDTPPPSGSPAEQFENFCDENPQACG
jgi:hypothetical protein